DEAADPPGFELTRELKPNEQVKEKPEGADSIKIVEETRGGRKVRLLKVQYPPIGADVMRWLYCRHNPAQNLNFGLGPANELRSRFVLKLWNTYAFFCNYARLDGFDPTAPQVPVSERPDIDRWILSDLQLLIGTARRAFEEFNVLAFCLEA